MALDESDFNDRLLNLQKTWAAGEKVGVMRSEPERIWSVLSLELEFSGKPLAEIESIAWLARQWLETKNPHYIDAAFVSCRAAGITTPPTLLQLVEDVADTRLAGLERGGKGTSIRNAAVHEEGLRILCCLHLAGAPVEMAASKAARYIADHGFGKTYKASTLELDYGRKYRRGQPNFEAIMRTAFERADGSVRKHWTALVADLPEADDDLKGNRRA
jgi:hypothetical protein